MAPGHREANDLRIADRQQGVKILLLFVSKSANFIGCDDLVNRV